MDYTVAPKAQNLGSGDITALQLKVMEEFVGTLINSSILWNMRNRVFPVRTLLGAKQTQFVLNGAPPAPITHVEGEALNGQSFIQTEAVIGFDAPLRLSQSITLADFESTHYINEQLADDVLKMGQTMANEMDQRLMNLVYNGSGAAAISRIHSGGTRVTFDVTSGQTVADAFPTTEAGGKKAAEAFYTTVRKLREKNINGRIHAFISPYFREVLSYGLERLFDRNYSAAGANDLNKFAIAELAGCTLYETNHMPSGLYNADGSSGGRAVPTQYQGNFTSGGVGQPAALFIAEGRPGIGGVTVGDPQVFVNKELRGTHGAELYSVRMREGYGVVYPTQLAAIDVKVPA